VLLEVLHVAAAGLVTILLTCTTLGRIGHAAAACLLVAAAATVDFELTSAIACVACADATRTEGVCCHK